VKRCSAEPGPSGTSGTPEQQRITSQERRAALHPGNERGNYNLVSRSRSALPTTLTDDSAIAAAAMIGDSNSPNVG
jgi:hypothetical protein